MNNFTGIKEKAKSVLETNIYYHSLALAACMEGLFDYFNSCNLLAKNEPTKEEWITAGILHDIDYQGIYKSDHPNKTEEVLNRLTITVSQNTLRIIKSHAPTLTGVEPQNMAEWSIYCADSLTGLIVATALVYPTKKLSDVKLSSIMKRFLKEPKFAAGTRREEVKECENSEGLNLPLEKFVEICFESMKKYANEIGL